MPAPMLPIVTLWPMDRDSWAAMAVRTASWVKTARTQKNRPAETTTTTRRTPPTTFLIIGSFSLLPTGFERRSSHLSRSSSRFPPAGRQIQAEVDGKNIAGHRQEIWRLLLL